MTAIDPLQYGWWLASRASGIVAMLLITASVILGLAMAGRVSRRPGLARTLRGIHEQVALAGLVAIGVHGVTLLGDRWLHPGLKGIAVPFAMGYRPLFTGLGILAGYLAAILGLTFYARRRIGARLWRRMHRFTVAVYVLGLIHALGAGTDAGSPWLRTMLLASTIPVGTLFANRVLSSRRRRARPRPAAVEATR
jgi:methionine sulfoxide reductase heme-binding subunit